MTPISAFRPRVAVRIQGASDPLIDQMVLDSCIAFCEQSLVVRRMYDTFQTQSGEPEYALSPVGNSTVASIMRVWVDDVEIGPLTDDQVRRTVGNSTPTAFGMPEPGVLGLYPTPDAAYNVNMRVALRPQRNALYVEDELFDTYVEPIVDGALARLYAMPAEPFFDKTMAAIHAGGFRVGVSNALLNANSNRIRGQLRIQPVHI